jgi:hypothetical protein
VTPHVPLHSMNDSEIVISADAWPDRKLTIVNIPNYSGETIAGIFERTFAEAPAALQDSDAVRNGEVEVGMSKESVLLTRGYPPKHRTPSLDGVEWTYWHNRFKTVSVIFGSDGRVKRIVR